MIIQLLLFFSKSYLKYFRIYQHNSQVGFIHPVRELLREKRGYYLNSNGKNRAIASSTLKNCDRKPYVISN